MKIIINKILMFIAIFLTSLSCLAASTQYTNGIDDESIAVNVKAKLAEDSSLRGLDITVISQDGVVILDGVVNTQAQIDSAINYAKSINGVKEVQSVLDLESTKPQ